MGYQKPPIGTKLNHGHPLAKRLAGCWLFNEMSGNKVFDYSGQNNHGTITGVAAETATSGWNAGPQGNVMAFDGSNDCVVLASTISAAYEMTYIAWVRKLANTVSVMGASGTYKYIAHFFTDANLYCGNGSSGQVYWPFSGFDSTWRMIALTKRGSTLEMYYDSISQGTRSQAALTDVAYLAFGQTNYFNGSISSIFIYNRALSAAEIAYLTAFPYCMFESAFQLEWGIVEPPPSAFTPRIVMIT
jgi:hypothetical protein